MNIKLKIPDNFFVGEELCGHYVSPEVKKLWAIQLDLLAEFSRVCSKCNIKWYVGYGTLLGAVRHKGFIPWDDDVDVVLMREDFERLCEIAHFEFKYPYYFALPEEAGYAHLSLFSKFFNDTTTFLEYINYEDAPPMRHHGIYIDIFILDGLPEENEKDSLAELNQLIRNAIKYYRWSEGYYPAKKFWRRQAKAIMHKIIQLLHMTYGDFMRKFKDIVSPDSKHVLDFFIQSAILDRSDFNETTYLPFEMLSVPAPSRYINVLDKLYGNWNEYVKSSVLHSVFIDVEHTYTDRQLRSTSNEVL